MTKYEEEILKNLRSRRKTMWTGTNGAKTAALNRLVKKGMATVSGTISGRDMCWKPAKKRTKRHRHATIISKR